MKRFSLLLIASARFSSCSQSGDDIHPIALIGGTSPTQTQYADKGCYDGSLTSNGWTVDWRYRGSYDAAVYRLADRKGILLN